MHYICNVAFNSNTMKTQYQNPNTTMKRTFKLMAYAMMMLAPGMCLTGCSDDTNESAVLRHKPIEISAAGPLSPEDQKERLEDIRRDFNEETANADFSRVTELLQYIRSDRGPSHYSWNNVNKGVADAFQDFVAIFTEREKPERLTLDYFVNLLHDVCIGGKSLVALSALKGEFTAADGEWTQTKTAEEVSHLRFLFEDEEGLPCSLTFERATMTLVQNDEILMRQSLSSDFAQLFDTGIAITDRSFALQAKVEYPYLGYELNISKVSILGRKRGPFQLNILKNENTLFSVAFAEDITDLPSYQEPEGDLPEGDEDPTLQKNAIELNLMDQLQLRGNINHVGSFMRSMVEAQHHENEEEEFKACVDQANAQFNLSIFYDWEQYQQASFKFTAFDDEDYWVARPTLYFSDGTSYVVLEDILNWEVFRSLARLINGAKDAVTPHSDID